MDYTPQQIRAARKASGLARFERECPCGLMAGSWVKRWRIPGTAESGRHAMLLRHFNDLLEKNAKREASDAH